MSEAEADAKGMCAHTFSGKCASTTLLLFGAVLLIAGICYGGAMKSSYKTLVKERSILEGTSKNDAAHKAERVVGDMYWHQIWDRADLAQWGADGAKEFREHKTLGSKYYRAEEKEKHDLAEAAEKRAEDARKQGDEGAMDQAELDYLRHNYWEKKEADKASKKEQLAGESASIVSKANAAKGLLIAGPLLIAIGAALLFYYIFYYMEDPDSSESDPSNVLDSSNASIEPAAPNASIDDVPDVV